MYELYLCKIYTVPKTVGCHQLCKLEKWPSIPLWSVRSAGNGVTLDSHKSTHLPVVFTTGLDVKRLASYATGVQWMKRNAWEGEKVAEANSSTV